jgi:hypothetical protein
VRAASRITACAAVLIALLAAAPAWGAHPAHKAASSQPRAPAGPPLVSGTGAGEFAASPGADSSSSAPTSGGDPLVANGLGSPLCAGASAAGLSAVSRHNCSTSGFEAAAAPTGDYGLDVHIDTGALGFTMSTIEQDYLIAPVWMGLVWLVHTVVVALEWCFTLNLLDSAAMSGIERALRNTQSAFTRPWLTLALALAGVAAAYNGLVRRRVAETLGQAALLLAMIAGALWVVVDPTGTIGALARFVDQASIGTVGTVAQGTPSHATRTLADGMGTLFAGVVGAPWCYLEFGDVRWCSDPALLDPRLQRAALALAAGEEARSRCSRERRPAEELKGMPSEAVCAVVAEESAGALTRSAALLRAARTNGELFLALPTNGPGRNSINDDASLLRTLCASSNATGCRGPTAAQAEFRTAGGTFARLGGLLLILAGALGMLLLLGYIGLHLLGAELVGLLYLLLAPLAAVAPALGEHGRATFRAWAARLIGAVVSKLIFSFLLGVVLLLTHLLLELEGFGWWTRWLLVSASWWGAYLQRRRALALIRGELRGQSAGRGAGPLGHQDAHDPFAWARHHFAQRAAARAERWKREHWRKPAPYVPPRKHRRPWVGGDGPDRRGPGHEEPDGGGDDRNGPGSGGPGGSGPGGGWPGGGGPQAGGTGSGGSGGGGPGGGGGPETGSGDGGRDGAGRDRGGPGFGAPGGGGGRRSRLWRPRGSAGGPSRAGGVLGGAARAGAAGGAAALRSTPEGQVAGMLHREHLAAAAATAAAPSVMADLGRRRAQLQRVHVARGQALAAGDARRGVQLDTRARRIEADIERADARLLAARTTAARAQAMRSAPHGPRAQAETARRAVFLDEQAQLAPRGRPTGGADGTRRRDYAALAGLAGHAPVHYETLDPASRRKARVQIDRALALRRELHRAHGGHPRESEPSGVRAPGASERPPGARPDVPAGARVAAPESPVMRDAHEVAARRKRQLGYGRP